MTKTSPTSLKNPKVYKNRKLNNANFGNFTHNDYQVFLYLITKIGGVDKKGKYLQPSEMQRNHNLTALELSKQFNIDPKNSYKTLKKSIDKLMKTDIRIQKIESKTYTRINVCSQAEYNKQRGSISIQFTDSIMPYLAQVREKFVLYNLKEITNFNSIYTTRFYELMQEYKTTGIIIKSIPQLREVFGIDKEFPRYFDFKKYTFKKAIDEINMLYNLKVKFEEIKECRKVIAVKFTFTKTEFCEVKDPVTGIVTKQFARKKQYAIPGYEAILLKDKNNTKRKNKNIKIKGVTPQKKEIDILEGQLAFDSASLKQDSFKRNNPPKSIVHRKKTTIDNNQNTKQDSAKSIGSIIKNTFYKIFQ